MPWDVRFSPTSRFIEMVLGGSLSPEELETAVRAAAQLAQENDSPLFLCDCSALDGGHSVFDLYRMLDIVASSGLVARFREALVFTPATPSDSREMVEFWELGCRNRGFDVRLFTDRDEAVAWLGT